MLAKALADAWNVRDPQRIAAVYAPDGVRDEIAWGGNRLVGRDAIAAGVGAIIASWPDCELVDHVTATCDNGLMVLEWSFVGTWGADYGPLLASHRRGELRGVSLIVPDGDLIREERVYWDTATLMAEAGMIAAPA